MGTAVFKQFKQAYEQAARQAGQDDQNASSVFNQFGIDPKSWLTNVSNEGTTDVDGTDTIHIHGDANVPQIVSDFQKIAQQAPGDAAQQLTPSQLDQLESAIKNASVDVYSGTDDKMLRKLALSLSIEPPALRTRSTVSSVDVDFSVTLSDVNEPQTIIGALGRQAHLRPAQPVRGREPGSARLHRVAAGAASAVGEVPARPTSTASRTTPTEPAKSRLGASSRVYGRDAA